MIEIPKSLLIGVGYFTLIFAILLIGVSLKGWNSWGIPYIVAGLLALVCATIMLVFGYKNEGFAPRVQAPISVLSRTLGWGDPYPTPLYQH